MKSTERVMILKIFIESNNLTFKDFITDGYDGSTYGTIHAFMNEEEVGFVDYILYEKGDKDIFYISLIETLPKYRGQGIATEMCRYIKDNYSNYEVDWGVTTQAGEQLRKKLTRTVENKNYTNLKNKINKIKLRMQELEDFVNTDNEDEFERLRQSGDIERYGDEWEELNSQLWQLDQLIDNEEPYFVVWKDF